MLTIHQSETRGFADHGWLKSRHTFSFGEYYDPDRMGFGALRVINDDYVAPAKGFGTHSHKDMEIISIPLHGRLQHKDSEGNSTVIKTGEVQIMSAGSGIAHSEFNGSSNDEVKFLQIWVLPKRLNVQPRYEQKDFSFSDKKNKFLLVISPDGIDSSLSINQDAFFSLTDLDESHALSYSKFISTNSLYLFVISGAIEIEGKVFKARDGIGIKDFTTLKIFATHKSEILLMEIPF